MREVMQLYKFDRIVVEFVESKNLQGEFAYRRELIDHLKSMGYTGTDDTAVKKLGYLTERNLISRTNHRNRNGVVLSFTGDDGELLHEVSIPAKRKGVEDAYLLGKLYFDGSAEMRFEQSW